MLKDDDCEEGEIKEIGDESPLSDDRPVIDRPLTPPSVCRFYLRGTCTWGGNCRFHHPGRLFIFDSLRFCLWKCRYYSVYITVSNVCSSVVADWMPKCYTISLTDIRCIIILTMTLCIVRVRMQKAKLIGLKFGENA